MKLLTFLFSLAALLLAGQPQGRSAQQDYPPVRLAANLAVPKLVRDMNGMVTISCDLPAAKFRYTLDGSDPNPTSPPYIDAFSLPQGCTVRARTFNEDRTQMSELSETAFTSLPGAIVQPTTLIPIPQDRDWPAYDWAKRHAAVTKLVQDRQPKLVFIGDSITQQFGGEPHDRLQPGSTVWEKYYSQRVAANLGFGQDYVENTLWRIQHGELAASPKVVVVLLGTNNLNRNTPEEIAQGMQALCQELLNRVPGAKVLLLGILPRGEGPGPIRDKISAVNQLLSRFNNVTFLDIGTKFLEPDGRISREVMSDFLHPTVKGYSILARAIEPTLKDMLGDAKL